MAVRYGEKPRPRVLVAADHPDMEGNEFEVDLMDHLHEDLGLQTVKSFEGNEYPPEWDCLLRVGERARFAVARIRVVAIGAREYAAMTVGNSEIPVRFSNRTTAAEFVIPEQLDHRISRLVASDLLPLVQAQERNLFLEPIRYMTPFLAAGASDEFVFAGSFIPANSEVPHWVLPFGADPIAWMRVALEVWSEEDPERFPRAPEWWRTPDWRTVDEARAHENLEAVKLDAAIEHERIAVMVQEAEYAVVATEEAADLRERVLLRGMGDELVAAVADALGRLGFTVRDMDREASGPKREDLRVTLEGVEGWEAIAEVKGYSKGARANDFLYDLPKYSGLYRQETGRSPSGLWFIVNAFKDKPPSERELAISDEEAVKLMASDHRGLIIDTRHLFELVRHSEQGRPLAEIQALLMNSAGRL